VRIARKFDFPSVYSVNLLFHEWILITFDTWGVGSE